jgi:hypothetical protein
MTIREWERWLLLARGTDQFRRNQPRITQVRTDKRNEEKTLNSSGGTVHYTLESTFYWVFVSEAALSEP